MYYSACWGQTDHLFRSSLTLVHVESACTPVPVSQRQLETWEYCSYVYY